MSEAEIARKSVRGSLILFAGSSLSAAINAVVIVLIARLLGPDQYGIYTVAFIIPGLLQLFIGLGVSSAVVRFSAYHNSKGQLEEARSFTKSAILLILLTGILLTLTCLLLSAPLSALMLRRPEVSNYVALASISILGTAALQASSYSALGWNWMGLSGVSQVVQAATRGVLAPLLIVVGLGAFGAIVGQSLSVVLAGSLGLLLLFTSKLSRPGVEARSVLKDVKEMLHYGFPIYIGLLVFGLGGVYSAIVLAAIASNATIGFYQAASNFMILVSVVSASITTALLPAFSSLDGLGTDARIAFGHATKYFPFFIVPIISFLVASSSLLIHMLYGPSYSPGVHYLQLLAAANMPFALGSLVLPSFFSGFGRPRLTLYTFVSGTTALVISAPLLSIQFGFGVEGLIYSQFISNSILTLVGFILARWKMGMRIDISSLLATLFASLVSIVSVLLIPSVGNSDISLLLIYAVVFPVVYFTIAPLVRALDEQDIEILTSTIGDLRLLGKLVAPILRYERFLLSFSAHRRTR